MSLRGWLLTLVLLPLALVSIQTLGMLFVANGTRQTEQDVNRFSELYSSVAQVETSLLQAEVYARAYLSTADAGDIESYEESRRTVENQLQTLSTEAQTIPALAGQVPELERLAQRRLGRLDAGLRSAALHGSPAKQVRALNAESSEVDAFGVVQKQFADAAYDLRTQRLAGLSRLWAVIGGLLVFAGIGDLILTLILVIVAQRHLVARIERVAQRAAAYWSGSSLRDGEALGGNDEIARLDTTLRSMSETILRREGELRSAVSDAEAASEAKSAFVATVSHELRTPLNGVIGMSELLMESPLDERQSEYVQAIQTSSGLLLSIISEILDFSKLTAGRLSINSAPIDLSDFIRSVVAPFSVEAQAKGLAFGHVIGPGVPDAVLGDEVRLRQILNNIVGNALKFTSRGSVVLAIDANALGGELVMTRFAVSDTGPGVPAASHEAIFEPFRQADMSKTRGFGGTGLGLSISRQLATLMNGTIEVRNGPQGGAIFTLAIPFVRVTAAPANPLAEQKRPLPTVKGDIPARPEHVLVVEDNEINQRVAKRMLQRLGLQPEIAVNGREALDVLEQSRFDLVLMDLQMPVMDGLEASIEVRRREAGSGEHVPIVAMTANVLPEDREQCAAAGMDDHIGKPITLAELERVIRRWLPATTESP